jgi:hypothetical protein
MENEMILCIEITAVFVPYEFSDTVVLDGGGHVHYNKCKHGKEVYPNKTCGKCHSGNRILEPQRLKKAIDKVENKGFRAIAFMGFLTIKWARDHPDKLANDGTKTFNDLLNQGKIIPVGKKREDVWWLSYALDEQAYIFTNDKFQDKFEYETVKKTDGSTYRRKKKDENGDFIIKEEGERTLYPGLDWKEIDARTFQFEFMDGTFVVPDLPTKDDSDIRSSKSKLLGKLRDIEGKHRNLQQRYDALLARSEMEAVEHGHEETIKEIFSSELAKGSMEVKQLYYIISREVLRLPKDISEWPDDWERRIREELGYNLYFKTITLMEDLSLLLAPEQVYFYPGEIRSHVKLYDQL